ncbi:MAG: hypothetical protein Q9227_002893 [Pyrenula ochraceoflavens]
MDSLKFADGDVLVAITATKTFQLHASTLRRTSSVFAKLLAEEDGAILTSKAKKEGATTRYCLELRGNTGNGVGEFEQKAIDTQGRPVGTAGVTPSYLEAGKPNEMGFKYWSWLFSLIYYQNVEFDDSNLATVLKDCMALADIADCVEAMASVRIAIDLNLLRQGHMLWNAIAGSPTDWAKLALRIQSVSIYKEAIIHAVGKWKMIDDLDKGSLDTETRKLCDKKFHELDVAKEAIEIRILGHYPTMLTRVAADRPSRGSYSSDIYMWMAVAFFRQWFAQAVSAGENRLNQNGGYDFYHQLGRGGQAYLNHESFTNFHLYFPMSGKACNVVEANMSHLKEDIRPFVQDLLVHNANLDVAQYPGEINWLTCLVVERHDFPWRVEEQVKDESDDVPAAKRRRT